MAGRCVRSGGAADTVAFTFDRAGQRRRNTVSCPDANPGARPFIGRLAIRQDPVRRLRPYPLFVYGGRRRSAALLQRLRNRLATVCAHTPTNRRTGLGAVEGRNSDSHRRCDPGDLQRSPSLLLRGDHAPGEIKCQAVVEFGGGWYVVDG